jgi:hypothetical protein
MEIFFRRLNALPLGLADVAMVGMAKEFGIEILGAGKRLAYGDGYGLPKSSVIVGLGPI